MAEFKSFMPSVEVTGEAVNAFSQGFPSILREIGTEILRKHGIDNPGPGAYYPLQAFLDAMKEISDGFGSQMLYRIGCEIARNAKLPPGMDGLNNCLMALDTAYHLNHRNGSIGSYSVTIPQSGGFKSVTNVICANPYPCSFDWGVIEGFAQRFKPPGSIEVVVRHDDASPCRKKGADSCTYLVTSI